MMQVHSPVPDRQQECHDDELSPVSDVTFGPTTTTEANAAMLSSAVQDSNLSLPRTETCPTSPQTSRINRFSSMDGSNHQNIQRPQQATAIFASDLGVEVATVHCEGDLPTTPTFQRRGRFIVWPASFGQEQTLTMERRS